MAFAQRTGTQTLYLTSLPWRIHTWRDTVRGVMLVKSAVNSDTSNRQAAFCGFTVTEARKDGYICSHETHTERSFLHFLEAVCVSSLVLKFCGRFTVLWSAFGRCAFPCPRFLSPKYFCQPPRSIATGRRSFPCFCSAGLLGACRLPEHHELNAPSSSSRFMLPCFNKNN